MNRLTTILILLAASCAPAPVPTEAVSLEDLNAAVMPVAPGADYAPPFRVDIRLEPTRNPPPEEKVREVLQYLAELNSALTRIEITRAPGTPEVMAALKKANTTMEAKYYLDYAQFSTTPALHSRLIYDFYLRLSRLLGRAR